MAVRIIPFQSQGSVAWQCKLVIKMPALENSFPSPKLRMSIALVSPRGKRPGGDARPVDLVPGASASN